MENLSPAAAPRSAIPTRRLATTAGSWSASRPEARSPRTAKEKRRVDAEAPGAVRFQGEIPLAAGGSYLDRTTLTPLDGGRVRQVIEVSRSGGDAWQTVFDAVYVRKATAGN